MGNDTVGSEDSSNERGRSVSDESTTERPASIRSRTYQPPDFGFTVPSMLPRVMGPPFETPTGWDDLARQSRDGKPPLEAIFCNATKNPFTQQTFLQCAVNAVELTKELFALRIVTALDSANNNCKKSSIKSYLQAVYINGLALIINCACSTFQGCCWSELSMNNFVAKFSHDGKKMEHYVNNMLNLAKYLFLYHVPGKLKNSIWIDVNKRKLSVARQFFLSKKKLSHAFWSYNHVSKCVVSTTTSFIREGHNFDVALWADRVVSGGVAAVAKALQPKEMVHFISDIESKDMFAVNDGKRLWDARGNSEVEQNKNEFFQMFYRTAQIRSVPRVDHNRKKSNHRKNNSKNKPNENNKGGKGVGKK